MTDIQNQPPSAPPPPVAPPPQQPPPQQPVKSGKGCWVYGCGGCLGLTVLLMIGAFFVFRAVQGSVNQPPFPQLELSQAEERELDVKMRKLGLREEDPAEPVQLQPGEEIVLSAQELTAILARENPELADVVRFTLEPDLVRAELRVGEGSQRMVVQGAFSVVQEADRVKVHLRDLRMGPFRLPGFLRRELAEEDLMGEFFEDEENRRRFEEMVERIEIRQDEIRFVPGPRAGEPNR